MGASGFIPDPADSMSIEVRCSVCSRLILMYDPPIKYHQECIQEDGRLAVTVELDNYEER